MRSALLFRRAVVALLLVGLTTTGLATTASADPGSVSQVGDHNAQVLDIENKLVAINLLTPGYNDGYYTEDTAAAVRTLQQQVGLSVTGITDGATSAALTTRWTEMGQPAPADEVFASLGSKGSVVKRLQDMLVSLGLLANGYNTGLYDLASQTAVQTFQTNEGIPVTGVVNLVTYRRLLFVWNAYGRPAAPPNPVVAKPGDSGAGVKRFQNILISIQALTPGYASGTYDQMTTNAVTAFQRVKGLPATGVVNQTTYNTVIAEWTAMGKPTVPVPGSVAAKLDPRCLRGAKVICINKGGRKLYYLVNGKVARSWDIRIGREGFSTREGTYSIFRKELKSWSKPYQVWMPYSMYFSGGQAVHFSYEFANYGYLRGSHGCVNMRDWKGIAWLYSQAPVGTKVVVYS